jgi:HK97 gp10 family phage protein
MTIVARLDTRELDAMAATLGVSTAQALSGVAFQVEAESKVRAPVDTGALKNSMHTEKKSKDTYWVADGVEYGIYQEFGTSRMAAQPFLVPAVEHVRRTIHEQFGGLFR